jgi:serine/threonine protein kinase
MEKFAKAFQYVQFDTNTRIGRGSFGQVYGGVLKAFQDGTETSDEMEVAVKRFHHFDDQNHFLRQIDVMSRIRHPACLSLIAFDLAIGKGQPSIVSEKMSGDLGSVLKAAECGKVPPGWDDTAKSIIALGVAAALSYLHSQNIMHRDVNPDNVLLDRNFYPRIGGFSCSKMMPPEGSSPMTDPMGTPMSGFMSMFMAPERCDFGDCGYPVDVYSYGFLLYFLLINQRPFARKSPYQILVQATKGVRPTIPPFVNQFYTGLMQRCWSHDASTRPTFAAILCECDEFKLEGCDEGKFNHYKREVLKLN